MNEPAPEHVPRCGSSTLARDANLIPVSVELMADCDTPVAAFQKLLDEDTGRQRVFASLLESAENSEQIGRYSFLGNRPAVRFSRAGERASSITANKTVQPPVILSVS